MIKIGSLHGRDDAFYRARYGAKFWALPGMVHEHGLVADQELSPGGEMPFAGCSVFVFRTTKRPECILRIDRAGGILVACDSLQNWVEPDKFFSDESRQMMTEMGFFQPANLGPVVDANERAAGTGLRSSPRVVIPARTVRSRRAAARHRQGSLRGEVPAMFGI